MKNQGRSKRQVKNNYKVMEFIIIAFISFIIIGIIGKVLNIW